MYRLSLALVLVCAPVAWADVTVIYRASDDTIAGWVRPPQSVAQEVRNLTQSAGFAGSQPSDFATATVTEAAWAQAKQQGKLPTVAGGKVVFVPDPAVAGYQAKREAIRQKLGLTDKEFSDLQDALR